MLIHECDGLCIGHPSDAAFRQRERQCYYAEVPVLSLEEQSRLIEQVIQFAFDTLGARYLEVRVFGAVQDTRRVYGQNP